MEALMSASERKQRIIADIVQDSSLKTRLNNDRGTAILVAASIYDACHYYQLRTIRGPIGYTLLNHKTANSQEIDGSAFGRVPALLLLRPDVVLTR
jgi:hypothetical protein